MSIYTESGISINLSKYPHLRLKDCEGYQSISEFFFKEVDFIWWSQQDNCLYLSDFKDFSNAQSRSKIEKVIPNLVDKTVHSLTVLSTIWLNTNGASDITKFFKEHLPQTVLTKVEVKIIHVINCASIFDMHFSAINSAFMQRFGAFHKLFDIETSLILPISKAQQYFDVFQ